MQQKNLFEEFVLLRSKYDEIKLSLINLLWQQCAPNHPDLLEIPSCVTSNKSSSQQKSKSIVENDNQVGEYSVGDLLGKFRSEFVFNFFDTSSYLGEGQFATVRCCTKNNSPTVFALKIIQKERITTFNMLKRINNEIYALKHLSSNHIIQLIDVLHTENRYCNIIM